MKTIETNRLIALGLIIMGVMSISGWIVHLVLTGNSGGTEIPIAVVSGLGGVLTGKSMTKESDKT